MNITKIYYEELRSECINGKWQSKKIGAEVTVGEYEKYDDSFNYAKEYVKRNLDNEEFAEKTTKEMLKDIQKQAKKLLNGL